jgi:phosphoglycolate phosphatase-like HAD superfamily hydrolase
MKRVRAVIMDLDDTLWDWVGMWYQSFNAMLD